MTDTFVAEQGAGGEAMEDLDKGIVREAGQCLPHVGGLLHFIYNEIIRDKQRLRDGNYNSFEGRSNGPVCLPR